MKNILLYLLAIVMFVAARTSAQSIATKAAGARVPVIYSTDLFHPHDDPDDHFDLATIFAIRELEVRAVILDLGERQRAKPGRIPLGQMLALTGAAVPYAAGLSTSLNSPAGTGRDQPSADQSGVELLIKTLRSSSRPVTVITAGSLRDVAAAFNREPALLREKIGRLYVNVGNADGGSEWNVGLDVHAYVAVMRSGLPIYWCPCQPFRDPRSTFWEFEHAEVLDRAPAPLQNFFIYALQVVPPDLIDPLDALGMDLRPWRRLVWKMRRQMWCTAPFLHAAGLGLVATADGGYEPRTKPASDEAADELFTFVPARVEIDDGGRTRAVADGSPNMHVFRIRHPEHYEQAMTRWLALLFERFPLAEARKQSAN